MKGECISVDKRIPDVDLAKKYLRVFLVLWHHSKEAAGNTQISIVRAGSETRWYRVLRIPLGHVKHSQAAIAECFNDATQQPLERHAWNDILLRVIANVFFCIFWVWVRRI